MFLEALMPVTKLFSALAVPIIGFLGVYIAWKQWETAAYRYRMDLFDKRFGIYEATIDFILSIRGGGHVSDVSVWMKSMRSLVPLMNLKEY